MASPTLTFQEGLITLPQELTDFLIQLENYLNDLKQIRTETIDHLKNQIDESLHQWSEKIHELKIQLTHLPQEIKNHDIILNLKKRLENCEAKANSCYLNLCSAIHDSQTKRNWNETFIQFVTSLKKYREEAAKLAKETQSFSVRQMLEKMAQGGKILASRTRLQWRRKIFHTFNGLFGLWLWGYSGLSEFAVIMILATFLSFAIGTEILYDKETILKMYLNQVSFGGPAYGIEEASQQYFGVSAKDLSISQASFLAGLPKAPSKYSPYLDPALSLQRQHQVLSLMRKNNYLTDEQYQAALKQKLNILPPKIGINAPHFVMYVKDILVDLYGENLVNRGGLKVTTTLDLNIQEYSQKAVVEELKRINSLNVTNGSVLVTKPETGEILV